jgi:predicted nucleic acid-binding protein
MIPLVELVDRNTFRRLSYTVHRTRYRARFIAGYLAILTGRAGALESQHMGSDAKPDLGPGDAIVAATGLTMDEAVVTSNGDFGAVDGLDVELY